MHNEMMRDFLDLLPFFDVFSLTFLIIVINCLRYIETQKYEDVFLIQAEDKRQSLNFEI